MLDIKIVVFNSPGLFADIIFMSRPSSIDHALCHPLAVAEKFSKKFIQNKSMWGIKIVVLNASESISDVIFITRPFPVPLASPTTFSSSRSGWKFR